MKKKTKDIYFAAVLMALGAKYLGADKTDPRHMEFEFFIGDMDIKTVEASWANAMLMINAVDFKNAVQQMKSIIHSD